MITKRDMQTMEEAITLSLSLREVLLKVIRETDSPVQVQTSEDLEEAVISIWKCRADGDASQLVRFSYDEVVALMRTGARWQKEQMLKEAVEGKAVNYGLQDTTISVDWKELNEALQPLGVKAGDRVKVIIVKEDGK